MLAEPEQRHQAGAGVDRLGEPARGPCLGARREPRADRHAGEGAEAHQLGGGVRGAGHPSVEGEPGRDHQQEPERGARAGHPPVPARPVRSPMLHPEEPQRAGELQDRQLAGTTNGELEHRDVSQHDGDRCHG